MMDPLVPQKDAARQVAAATEQPSSSAAHRPDFDPSTNVADGLTVKTNLMLYRFIPIGSYTLSFNYDTELRAALARSRCGCGCGLDVLQSILIIRSPSRSSLQVKRQALCNFCRLVRDAVLSFVLAFMFHLFPAILWGAERSLGSSSNHIAMGYIWFGGWPVWFIVLQFLRPWGIDVDSDTFIPFASWKHAMEVVEWWEKAKNADGPLPPLPEKPKLLRDPWFIGGWFFFLFLFVNMIVTGVLVVQCNDRGCCKDDEDTLDCCVETGYPEC